MLENTAFQRLIPDTTVTHPEAVTKLILCTGKTYYDLEAARKERGKTDQMAIVRIEQVMLAIVDRRCYPKIVFPTCALVDMPIPVRLVRKRIGEVSES